MAYNCVDGVLNYLRLVPTFMKVILILFAIIGIACIILNSLVLISIWKTPSLRKPSYVLIASLALSDLLIGVVVEPLTVVTGLGSLGKGWNEALCSVWKVGRGLSYWLAAVSLYTLAAISLDRLLAIRLRNTYRNVVTLKRVAMLLGPFWIGSLIVIVPLFLSVKSKHFDQMFLFFGTCAFILTLAITICYSMAFCLLRKLTSSVSPSSEGRSKTTSNIDVTKYRKSLRTTFLVFIVIVIFYTPYACFSGTLAVFYTHKDTVDTHDRLMITVFTLNVVGEVIVVLNSFVNPVMYVWRMNDIRMAVKNTLNNLFRK